MGAHLTAGTFFMPLPETLFHAKLSVRIAPAPTRPQSETDRSPSASNHVYAGQRLVYVLPRLLPSKLEPRNPATTPLASDMLAGPHQEPSWGAAPREVLTGPTRVQGGISAPTEVPPFHFLQVRPPDYRPGRRWPTSPDRTSRCASRCFPQRIRFLHKTRGQESAHLILSVKKRCHPKPHITQLRSVAWIAK